MSRPNLKITFNGMDFVGGSIIFRGETRTLTLMDPVMGAIDMTANSSLPCEWVDLDIPTIMRNEAKDQGKTTGTIASVVAIYTAAYNAELDQATGG